MDRIEVGKQIKANLKKRTGRIWSVTGGRGTAWGWMKIAAPKNRRVMHDNNPAYTFALSSDQDELPWIERQPEDGETGWYTSMEDRLILSEVLGIGLNQVTCQGVSISPDSRDFFLDRAINGKPEEPVIEEPEPVEPIGLPDAPHNVELRVADYFTNIKQPHGCKYGHLYGYFDDLARENYDIVTAKVIEIAALTNDQYDNLIDGNLLTDLDWLAGKGGHESTAVGLRQVEFLCEYNDEELAEWRAHMYAIVIAVTAPDRATIYINPEGYDYARYVGFDLEYGDDVVEDGEIEPVDEPTIEDHSQPVIVNVVVAMASELLKLNSAGDVLNILIGSGLESKEALAILHKAM